jgi:hypothetical protein
VVAQNGHETLEYVALLEPIAVLGEGACVDDLL